MPLVSIIIPTKNSIHFLEDCLISIRKQSFSDFEIIVVDNYSTDGTRDLALKYTNRVFSCGPERSAQVNFGARKALGKYIFKVDSDFLLEEKVLEQCVDAVRSGANAVVVHVSPDENISMVAKIRKFEYDMYKYKLEYSSARFIKKEVFFKIGGVNESLIVAEDVDFQNRLNAVNCLTKFISAEAIHRGESVTIGDHLRKMYFYGQDFPNYRSYNRNESRFRLGPFRPVYFQNIKLIRQQPGLFAALMFYLAIKFVVSSFGFIKGKLKRHLT